MNTYAVYLSDEETPWLHDVPRIVNVSECDYSMGHYTLLHDHEDVSEILLICDGKCSYSLAHRRYEISAGDVVLCNRGAVHEELMNGGVNYRTLCIAIANLQLPEMPIGCFLSEGDSAIFHQPAQFEALCQLVGMMLSSLRERRPYVKEYCQGLMLACLALIEQMVAERGGAASMCTDPLCTRVEEYIGIHYAEELTLERLGRTFHLSPYHLAHVFKQQTGYTLKQYILRLRIGHSQIALMYTTQSIGEIACAAGFEDAAHFSKLFSKYVGMPPSAYRELRKRE